MREIIGIIVGILGFFLLLSHTVNKHTTAPSPSPKVARQYSRSPSLSPLPVESSSPPSLISSATAGASSLPKPVGSSALPVPPQEKPAHSQTSSVTSHTPARRDPVNSHLEKIIHFQSGCTGLSRKDRTALNEILSMLHKSPNRQVTINGHTDDTGNRQFNQDLSRLRADVVRYYLATQGIDEARITTRGHGSSAPVADNKHPSGRWHNRRTEIIFSHDTSREN